MATTSAPNEPGLSPEELAAWRAYYFSGQLLLESLDRQLRQDIGIPHTWFGVLTVLNQQPERTLCLKDLGTRTFFSLSRLSHATNAMVASGWLRRRPDPHDRRSTLVTLTDSGLAALHEATRGHAATVRKLLIEPLGPGELRSLGTCCQKILDALTRGEGAED